ncbi:substrate-binding domain-containing protein [Amphritea japonica]|uniref:Phosphate transport system substrate-binding protein n=1 Tax=Amphritea japonica ATCC BAA-1530 TaxID=1278309 RepID=A0A7R6SRZ9_9GAMM|nr:substrate-binding domain-containing protein [Amphritea japonica]BBB25052.1 phosphate transport system substrate-binding protein [Amphritea japonica ATCC BAA-1530]
MLKTLAFTLLCLTVLPLSAAESIIIGGSGADLETFRILSRQFSQQHPNIRIKILPSIGSGGAVRGVSSQRVDIGLMSRPLSQKEALLGLHSLHYANTALIFITNKNQPITNVTLKELQGIYNGHNPVGGLKPVLRPHSDSDTLLLQENLPELIPAMNNAFSRTGIPIGITDQTTVQMVRDIDRVISTSTLSLVLSEKQDLNVLSLNGVTPTVETIGNGSYPLCKKLFMLHDGQLNNDERLFINFINSAEGQAILTDTGHQPVDL